MTKEELFGLRLKQLRKEKSWSQEVFGFHAQLNRSYIGAIERGEKNLTLKNIFKVAKALGVNPADLFDFSDLND